MLLTQEQYEELELIYQNLVNVIESITTSEEPPQEISILVGGAVEIDSLTAVEDLVEEFGILVQGVVGNIGPSRLLICKEV